MTASNNLQDFRYLSSFGGGELAGSKYLEPILFFLFLLGGFPLVGISQNLPCAS